MTLHSSPAATARLRRAFHWLTVIFVGAAYLLGAGGPESASMPPNARPAQPARDARHAVFAVVVLRLVWRAFDARRRMPMPAWMRMLSARAVALYALLVAVPLTAIVGAWLGGHPIMPSSARDIGPFLARTARSRARDLRASRNARRRHHLGRRPARRRGDLPSFLLARPRARLDASLRRRAIASCRREGEHAGAQAELRVLRPRPAAGFARRAHLHLRVHILRRLRRRASSTASARIAAAISSRARSARPAKLLKDPPSTERVLKDHGGCLERRRAVA